MHGQFVWYELMTSNSAAAKAFYPGVAGWAAEDWPHSQYTMWTAGGIPLGGIVQLRPDQLQQGMRSAWMPYIEAGDVDETARKAASIGGRVLFGPKDITGTGRFAVLADPQGAVFAIYHSLSPSEGFDGEPIPGRFGWHELTTTDPRGALDFYRRLFAWEATGSFTVDGSEYQMYGSRGRSYGGMQTRPREMGNMPPFWLCYIAVPDLHKSVAAAKQLGGRVLSGPMAVPGGGWTAVLTDPQGALFALYRPAPEAESAKRGTRAARKRPSAARSAKKPSAGKRSAGKRSAGKRSAGKRSAGKRSAGKRSAGTRSAKKTASAKKTTARKKTTAGRKRPATKKRASTRHGRRTRR